MSAPRKASMVVYGADFNADELAARVAAERPATLIVVSSTRVYGADPSHDLFMGEDTPVEAEPENPEREALVALEGAAQACAGSRRGGPRVVILRPVHVLGGEHEGVLGQVMRSAHLRTAFGFDPLMQLIHSDDVELAVDCAARSDIQGVFNVCGAGALPLSELSRATGTQRIAGIGGIISDLLERAKLRQTTSLPEDETRYFIHVDDQRFRTATGYAPRRTLPETVAALDEAASL
jgi:nucleoside-diphosphate-sugar epimerase